MKIKIIIALCAGILLSSSIEAQQLTRRSQYMINPYLQNPGAAGTRTISPIMVTYRNQWTGFDGAPVTYTLSGHCSLVNNLGAGIIFMRDDTGGAITRTSVELTGSYHVSLDRYNAISFGLSGLIDQFEFDGSELTVFDIDDPVLQSVKETATNIDANFGFMVYGDNYYIGVAVPQLFQSRIKVTTLFNTDDNSNVRHYYFVGQYVHNLNENFDLIPAAFIKLIGASAAQVDVSARLRYNESFWVGVTMRPKDAMVFMVGTEYNNFVLGYSYDATYSDASTYSPHSHELTLGYNIPRQNQGFTSKSLGGRKIIQRKRKVSN